MKETLFRGKTLPKENQDFEFNNVWVYGDLIIDKTTGKYYIHPQNNTFKTENEIAKTMVVHEVVPNTIGQYVGFNDIYNEMIFSGDIVRCYSIENNEYTLKIVSYAPDESRFVLSSLGTNYYPEQYITMEVIGNCQDNPELLKQLCNIE
nr:MAG TPA: YopX protein [Caudoviricetes sp.]